MRKKSFYLVILLILLVNACAPMVDSGRNPALEMQDLATLTPEPIITPEPFPTRPVYAPGELVDYIAQPGDTLASIASHFNTKVPEILNANSFIPADATTMPPSMPMKIPIYYAPFWGTPYKIIPDSLFVNGPAQVGFSTDEFVRRQPGWLATYTEWAADESRSGSNLVDLVARDYSISPRLLLALLEYQSGALSNPEPEEVQLAYSLGRVDRSYRGLYMQLIWTANTLNNAYYSWRIGSLHVFDLKNDRQERPDPWQNAGTVALQYYFSLVMEPDAFALATSEKGLGQVYQRLFGDPWINVQPHIPGSLQQPAMRLPFLPGFSWAYTGGPHTAWGNGEPLAAIDFAPGAMEGGCVLSDAWAVAVADGVVARSETGIVVLDLDGDGDERTGWIVFYLHLATDGRAMVGQHLKAGDPVGHPSCEGGRATGTHVHMARRYNGEWILAEGPLAFNLDGWIAINGSLPYQGYLQRGAKRIIACDCADQASHIQAEGGP
jgi:hypothetical protein